MKEDSELEKEINGIFVKITNWNAETNWICLYSQVTIYDPLALPHYVSNNAILHSNRK